MSYSRSFLMTKSLDVSGRLDIKSPADGFIKYFTKENNHTTVTFPEDALSFQINSQDLEERRVKISIHGSLIWEIYKHATVAFSVIPMEQIQSRTSILEYNFEFEKFSLGIEDPQQIVDTLVEHIRSIDENLFELNSNNSINAEYPPDECFKVFIEASKDDEEIEIEAEDWENRTTTMSLNDSHVKWTTTITPQQNSNGSHVEWTIEPERIEMDPDFFFTTAISIRDMIRFMLRI